MSGIISSLIHEQEYESLNKSHLIMKQIHLSTTYQVKIKLRDNLGKRLDKLIGQ